MFLKDPSQKYATQSSPRDSSTHLDHINHRSKHLQNKIVDEFNLIGGVLVQYWGITTPKASSLSIYESNFLRGITLLK